MTSTFVGLFLVEMNLIVTYISLFEIARDNISTCDFFHAFAERHCFTTHFPGT